MFLHDNLRVCLYALESWQPVHTIDIDPEAIAATQLPLTGWTASEVVAIVRMFAPNLLQAEAELIIEDGKCAIYVPQLSPTRRFCDIHCRGHIPAHNTDGARRLRELRSLTTIPVTAVAQPVHYQPHVYALP